jgi:hypothetical protein
LKIENLSLEITDLIIVSAFEIKINKFKPLNSARIKIEILKRLIRLTGDLAIIENMDYIALEEDLQELSKMTNGWIKYLK